jgi:prepilin-type N-terminal cleavage/methylation domain-containing protein
MNMKLHVESCQLQVHQTNLQECAAPTFNLQPSTFNPRSGFTMVEILVTMVLLALIVLALMTVFNSTQKAFRASLTQTDFLESGRLAMGLMVGDLEAMTPSSGTNYGAVNFYSMVTNYTSPPSPLFQSLVGAQNSGTMRANVLESFFSLSRQNINGSPSWVGTGYVVSTNSSDGALYPLYRFYTNVSVLATNSPLTLYYAFLQTPLTNSPPWSHLMDGVVDLRVRAYDPNGFWMTNFYDYYNNQIITNQNTYFLPPAWGEVGFYTFSNTVPASVEVELGVLEDAVLRRAEGLSGAAQTNYLSEHAGQVHLFRQRVLIRNVDPTAYQ